MCRKTAAVFLRKLFEFIAEHREAQMWEAFGSEVEIDKPYFGMFRV